MIPMQGSTYTLNGATIRDTHAIGSNGVVSLTEIVQKSSNVGTAKIAEKKKKKIAQRSHGGICSAPASAGRRRPGAW